MRIATLAAALVLANGGSALANPVHERLSALSSKLQAEYLGKFLMSEGFDCANPSRAFFQGIDSDDRAYWNVACDNGDAWVVQINPDARGTGMLMSCNVLKAQTGLDCFSKPQHADYAMT